MADKIKVKLGKREISIWKGWLPIFLILILPQAIISFAPWPEDFSRLIASTGVVIGGTLLFFWMVIVLNPKPMTDLQKRHITIEQYKKGNRLKRILQLILLILVISNTWVNIIPTLSSAYRYVVSGTVTYVKEEFQWLAPLNTPPIFLTRVFIFMTMKTILMITR